MSILASTILTLLVYLGEHALLAGFYGRKSTHVAMHRFPVLWRFHVMHHAATEMTIANGSRVASANDCPLGLADPVSNKRYTHILGPLLRTLPADLAEDWRRRRRAGSRSAGQSLSQ